MPSVVEPDLIRRLYRDHRPALVDYAAPIVGDRTRAEDIVQEAFMRLAPAGRAEPPVEQPLGYLYRVVRNLALDWVRRHAVERRRDREDTAAWLVPPTPATPEHELLGREATQRLRDALNGLPERNRRALHLHRFEGHTLQVVAERLGVSVATAHRLVRDAIVQVTLRLEGDEP